MQRLTFAVLALAAGTGACNHPYGIGHRPGSFGADLLFLGMHDSDLVVLKTGDARVIVSPKYQAKVFTSTNAGDTGRSFGWVHYKAFEGPEDPHMNAYGGENRLWLGPEGGKYSLFFPPGAKMEFANWKTPAVYDTEPWAIKDRTETQVTLQKEMKLTNYAGTPLSLSVSRNIMILNIRQISAGLQVPVDIPIKVVGYQTVNTLTNTGTTPWTEVTGMPCIWVLDMFPPSGQTTIVIPYIPADSALAGHAAGDPQRPATTDYFGEIPASRIKFPDSILFFKADGNSRGKLGIHPASAKNIAGSYDAEKQVLTIVVFDIDNHGRYLNQEWNTAKPPFSGDAVNAYNDGPLADGSRMGPFYELESVSPAAFLEPGGSITHRHTVYHFSGEETALDSIARLLLKVSLAGIGKNP
jgi:hypothetical protein